MDYDLFDWMEEDYINNQVVRVCSHCGASHKMFLTPDNFDEGWYVNGSDVRDTVIDCANNNYKFIFSSGIIVPMKEGNNATAHQAGKFMDWDYIEKTYPGFSVYSLEKDHPEVFQVDTEYFIRSLSDRKDVLKSISGYVSGIDWSGTEYEIKL